MDIPAELAERKQNLQGVMLDSSTNITHDGFPEEKNAHEFLRSFLEKASVDSKKLYVVHSEVRGTPLHRHHLQEMQDVRCDLIALPLTMATRLGAIVIDTKKSGITIGPGISQLHDYLNSVFDVQNGIQVMPTFGFLFPVRKQRCATASWMQHQHIGTIEVKPYSGNLVFFCGEERLMEFTPGGVLIHSAGSRSGRKMGSR